jgi:hypothetical protein
MTPERDRAMRLDHLRRGNEIRNHRARLKRRMAGGEITVAEILRSDDRMLDTMRLADLLKAVPGMREVKVNRALDVNRLGRNVPLSVLSPTRREELLDWIEAHHPRVGTGRMTVVQMEGHIEDLQSRVEGLETLLATSNQGAPSRGDEQSARAVERGQQRPSPAWERD